MKISAFRVITVLVLFFTIINILLSQEKEVVVTPVPIIAYSGDTGLILGAFGILLFQDSQNPEARDDQLNIGGFYTLKNQYSLFSSYDKYFMDDTLLNKGSISYSFTPSTFYEIGSDSSSSTEEQYTSRSFSFRQAILFNIAEDLYLGPSYKLSLVDILDPDEQGQLDRGEVSGHKGSRFSAAGVLLIYDRRDNPIYPTTGNYFETSLDLNGKFLGATEDSIHFSADYRHFFNLYQKKVILGLQAVTAMSGGDVPFTSLNSVGGSGILRGYSSSRYVDKHRSAGQAELRYPIFWKFSGTLFAGVANVAKDISSYQFEDTRYAGGTGLRFQIPEEEKVNLRLDFSFNREQEFDFNFMIMEAF